MSLTTFTATSAVRALFNKTAVGIPKGHFVASTIIDHVDKDKASLVGTAVDYMIRILLARYAKAKGIETHSDGYVAWLAIAKAKDSGNETLAAELSEFSGKCEGIFDSIIDRTYAGRHGFVDACYRMAKLDVAGRVGPQYLSGIHGHLVPGHQDYDVFKEILQFIDVINVEKAFAPKQMILLNPSFQHSPAVDGADADVFIDDTLFEIKTTSQNTLHRHYFEQLAGYAALAEIGGFSCLIGNQRQTITSVPIRNFGLFFPRQNLKLVYPIAELFGMFGWDGYVSGFRRLLKLGMSHAA